MYKADEGKVWDYAIPREDGSHLYGTVLYLGKGDSIDNYKQVDVSERDAYEAEQEKKANEVKLSQVLRELYPSEYEEE